jgi:ligand-binding sensor domain-containing protein/serine phosphatase RsbU (regulator of sigma subunit)
MRRLTHFAVCILLFPIGTTAALAAGPTLVRGSFWIPPERMVEFGQVYEERVKPFLVTHGFSESQQQGRATVDSVFSRLYSFRSVKTYLDRREKLDDLAEWDSLLVSLGSEFGTGANSDQMRTRATIFQTPTALDSVVVGSKGKTVRSGQGKGHWRSYDVTDGLSGPMLQAILETDDGHLWFGTRNNGVSRFDGDTWTQYRQADGLADDRIRTGLRDKHDRLWFGTMSGLCLYENGAWNRFRDESHPLYGFIWPLLEDRSGDLWFGSFDGVVRWDGERVTRYREADGLAGNFVLSAIQDQEGNFWLGTNNGVSRMDPAATSGSDFWTTYNAEYALPHNQVRGILEDGDGRIWVATPGGLVAYDGSEWERFTEKDGLPGNGGTALCLDRSGRVWVGLRGGAAVFDGKRFQGFSTGDGLVNNEVVTIHQDREGHLWFGTLGGVSQYDDRTWRTYREEDGLAHNEIWAGFCDSRGNLWFGTGGGFGAGGAGVSRFDGSRWTTYTTKDGLAANTVYSFSEMPSGDLWVGTSQGASRLTFADDGTVTIGSLGVSQGLPSAAVTAIEPGEAGEVWLGCFGGGLVRFDGKALSVYDAADGLAGSQVHDIFRDTDGSLWVAGYGVGLSRLKGTRISTYTTEDGLPHDEVILVFRDRAGELWIGTHGGVSRFDGKHFHSITTDDGLVSNDVHAIFQDRNGVLWFGTDGGGISLYDGKVFQSLTEEDGLASNVVMCILEDVDGKVWVGTNKGVTAFHRPDEIPPEVTISAVVAGSRLAGPEVSFTSRERLIGFEFQGTSLKTRPGNLVYRYRLEGLDTEWRLTKARRVEYHAIPAGYYNFEVAAVDRDLVHSQAPATVRVDVTLPYGRLALVLGLGAALVAFGVAMGAALKRRMERDRAQQELIETQSKLMEEMDRELQTAHEMQLGLLPKLPPAVEGFLMAGICLPANHVGGDYYNFLKLDDKGNRLAIVIADVSGHAMQAATVAMRFNEMLRYEITDRDIAVDILAGLDEALRGQIPPEMFVTCGIGILDTATREFSFASAGCPDVFHYNGGSDTVRQLGLTGYPLGLPFDFKRENPYGTANLTLGPGDVVAIASDGVEDAQNSLGAFYEAARLSTLIKQLGSKEVRPETIRDEIVSDVRRFMGDVQQPDDITVVAIKATRDDA